MVRTTPHPMKPRFKDLSPAQRAGVLALGSLQVALALTAWTDLAFRPAERVRGGKGKWAAIIAINFAGPVLYFTRGIRAVIPEKKDQITFRKNRGSNGG